MAEFCLECWNKINNTNYPAKKFILTDEYDLCEGCGELKKVVIMERRHYYRHKFRLFLIPFKMAYWVLYFLWRLIILPYTIYQYKKYEKLMAKENLMTGKMRLQKVDKLCLRGYLSVCGLSPASYPLLYTYRKCAGMPEAFTGSSFPQHTAVSLCGAGPGRGADVTARRLCWKKRPEHKRSGRFLGWIKGHPAALTAGAPTRPL